MPTAILDSVSAIPMSQVSIAVRLGTDPLKGSEHDRGTEAWARDVFQAHPHLKGKAQSIQCHCRNRYLQLSGVLPSYYLKQLAQEALKNQNHDFRIENQISVISPEDEFQYLGQSIWHHGSDQNHLDLQQVSVIDVFQVSCV